MSILYNPETREFHLRNAKISYVLCIYENGYAGQLYFGRTLSDKVSYRHLYRSRFDGFANSAGEFARFEYPSYGNGDFRQPAVTVVQGDGSSVIDPVYRAHRIYAGKKKIDGLPATYVESDAEADTLEIDLADAVSGISITLSYTVFENYAVIARHALIANAGTADARLACAMSCNLDLPDAKWDLLTLTGAWARECHVNERRLVQGIQGVASVRGASSHHQNPFIVMKRPNANDAAGEAIGLSLVYSGNFTAQCEVDAYGIVRAQIGINPDHFEWKLPPGSSFETPEAVLAWSGSGLNGLSEEYHGLYRSRLARGQWRDRPRPVLVNNWEGTYFNFAEAKILEMARAAKDLGAELFVLDDGWFGKRNDDSTSLGDWIVNPEKLPGGLASLADKVERMGLGFGLWIEPEMVSRASNLFERHPDWAIGIPGRPRTEGRHQYVLDMSRQEIVDYLFSSLSDLFSAAKISYVKWDMNRNITEPYSLDLPPDRQGEFFHKYILGVYSLYERLTTAFPGILFESCAGGGGRFDPGMLYYAPQGWVSDDSDAIERLYIQWGSSLCYPPCSIGAHVSAVPNHQTGRVTPFQTRAAVAFFGAFGYELDVSVLDGETREMIREQIRFYKKYRYVFQNGLFIRLVDPFVGNIASWMVVSEDRRRAVVGYYRILAQPSPGLSRLVLQRLDVDREYRVSVWPEGLHDAAESDNTGIRRGDELMQAGLLIGGDRWYEPEYGDFWSRVFVLTSD